MLGVASCAMAAWFPFRKKSGWFVAGWLALVVLWLVALGFGAAQLRTYRVQAPVLERSVRVGDITGRIVGLEKLEEGDGSRVTLDHLSIEKITPDKTPYKVRLKILKDANLQIGDTIKVLGSLEPPSAPVMPEAYDFQRYFYFLRIGASGFAFAAPEILERNDKGQFFERLRNVMSQRVEKEVTNPNQAAIVVGLMTGEGKGIGKEDWDALRNSGLAHLMAISGMNVAMVAGILFYFSRLLMALFPSFALHHPIKKYAAVIGFSGALIYTIVVGAPVPTQRAVITAGIIALAVLLDRNPFSLRLVCVSALAVLMVTPEALFGASFQMSFAAVAALVGFYELARNKLSVLYKDLGITKRIVLYIFGIISTTVIAGLATAPFSLFHFQQFALYGILANLLAIPLMSFVQMPCVLIAYVLMPFGLEKQALLGAGWGSGKMLEIAHGVANLPYAVWSPPVWSPAAFVLIVAAGLLFVMMRGWGRAVVLLPLVVGLWLSFHSVTPDIIVASSGKLMAIKDENGDLALSSRVADKFSAEIWQRRNGQAADAPPVKWRDVEGMHCDYSGCRIERNGQRIAFVFHPAAHGEDCGWADILIADDPVIVKPCRAASVIDRFDLWRNGAYALWLEGQGVRVQSVADTRGVRPWTSTHRR